MPGLAAVVILSLGVGIGVNTAVFSWIQTMVLQADPWRRRQRAASITSSPKSDTGTYPGMSWPEYRDLKPQLPSIEELVAFRMAPLNVGEAGRTERTYAQLVSGNFFTALGLQPAAGRFIRPDEVDAAGRGAGRRDLARLLADAFRRRADRDRPDAFASTICR